MQYKQGPQIYVRGSDLTDRKKCESAKVTLWREITPFELKCAIQENLEGPNEKQLFDKGNECALCGSALYEGLQDQTLEEVFEKQKEIIKAKFQKAITGKDQVKADLKVVKMSNCKGIHLFHKQCLENQFESSHVDKNLKCNVCGQLYGVQTGEMPPGAMSWTAIPFSQQQLAGYTYQNCPYVIVIRYNFSGGVQNGVSFTGSKRTAFLPGNKQGIEILTLLALAFKRKLSFRVGTSITTGQQNTVVWQGLYHKTQPGGGPTSFGYPDESYFIRAKTELQERGVTLSQCPKLEDPNTGYIIIN